MAATTEVTPRGETGETRPSPRGGGAARRALREGPAAWMLALPFCLLFLVFTAWPVVQSLFMSLTDTKSRDLRSPFAVNIVGFDNFTKALLRPRLPQGGPQHGLLRRRSGCR